MFIKPPQEVEGSVVGGGLPRWVRSETLADKSEDSLVKQLPSAPAEIAEGVVLGSVLYQSGLPEEGASSNLCVGLLTAGNPLTCVRESRQNIPLRAGDKVVFEETYWAGWQPYTGCSPYTPPSARWSCSGPSSAEREIGIGFPYRAAVQTEVQVVPFLTKMPEIEGEPKTGAAITAAYEKHPTSVGNEVIEWNIVRANGQRLVRYGAEYLLTAEDFGAQVSFSVRASGGANSLSYTSESVTVGTEDEGVLQAARDAQEAATRAETEKRELAQDWSRSPTVVIYSTRNVEWQGVGKVSVGFNTVPQAQARKWITRSHVRHATEDEVLTLNPSFCENSSRALTHGFCQ